MVCTSICSHYPGNDKALNRVLTIHKTIHGNFWKLIRLCFLNVKVMKLYCIQTKLLWKKLCTRDCKFQIHINSSKNSILTIDWGTKSCKSKNNLLECDEVDLGVWNPQICNIFYPKWTWFLPPTLYDPQSLIFSEIVTWQRRKVY